MNKISTTEDFIKESMIIHGDRYDYSDSVYVKKSCKLLIRCKKHGQFLQTPSAHLRGQGCKKCGLEKLAVLSSSSKNNFSDIVRRCREVHGDKYEYFSYTAFNKPFDVKCPQHGIFRPTPANHISNKTGCPICARETRNAGLRKTFTDFVEQARLIHGDKYEYGELDDYINNRTSVEIICGIHGPYIISRQSHLNGRGCKQCGLDKMAESLRMSFADFKKKANELYNNKYGYVEQSFSSAKGTVEIICPDHGIYQVLVQSHLTGSRCPRCAANLFEESVIKFVESLGLRPSIHDRTVLGNNRELDILIDNIAIECHGLYWHSYNNTETKEQRLRHYLKHDDCKNNNIQLIQIYENEWKLKREIVESIIKCRFGIGDRIYARNCTIIPITQQQSRTFLDDNHLQGYKHGVPYGLEYDGELIALLVMGQNRTYRWEIERFVCRKNIVVVGGLSRLFSRFVKDHNPSMVISYADRRYFSGRSYTNIGMVLDGITRPNYKYIKGSKIFSRQQFQKHKLKKKLQIFDSELTEAENMFNNGYRRIWDAGNYRFILRKS